MYVEFDSSERRSTQMRRLAVRRVRHALRRLTWLTRRVRVQLVRVSQHGQSDFQKCRVSLSTEGVGDVSTVAMARDWRSAVDLAVFRAARGVVGLWRERAMRRGQTRTLTVAR